MFELTFSNINCFKSFYIDEVDLYQQIGYAFKNV